MNRVERFPDFVRALPELDLPFAGARGWLIQGTVQQVVFIEFDETIEAPEHTHAEQWEFAIAGRVTLHRGGTSTEYHPGESFSVASGEPHAATVCAGYKAVMIFNQPDRYKARP
jgi:quercetin dioxygenase-like cupin family protein